MGKGKGSEHKVRKEGVDKKDDRKVPERVRFGPGKLRDNTLLLLSGKVDLLESDNLRNIIPIRTDSLEHDRSVTGVKVR